MLLRFAFAWRPSLWLAAKTAQVCRPRPAFAAAGSNPHLEDWGGSNALSRTEHLAHLGGRHAKAYGLVQAAVSASAPLSRAAKKEAGCGGCGQSDGKLSVCARCALRSYCSRDCQLKDYPLHKQR